MTNSALLQKLDKIDQLAKSVKLERLVNAPIRYAKGIFWKEIVYPITHKGSHQVATTFFDTRMEVLLPAGMDLYLLGAKSHDSEIRLAKWMILNVLPNKIYVDVGAHFGYFSLLASYLLQGTGYVFAFEASPCTFEILSKNIATNERISIYNKAVSNHQGLIAFYEFPTLYSEYNTLDTSQFKSAKWYQQNPPNEVKVEATTLDHFCHAEQVSPDIIKLDIEGAEIKALQGMRHHLTYASPTLLMEFSLTNLALHQEALHWMQSFGYELFAIQKSGSTLLLTQPVDYLTQQNLVSDNFVLQKV